MLLKQLGLLLTPCVFWEFIDCTMAVEFSHITNVTKFQLLQNTLLALNSHRIKTILLLGLVQHFFFNAS